MNQTKTGLIFNEDSDHFYHLHLPTDKCEHITANDLRAYIDTLANTDVTDFFCNVGGLLSGFPSKIKTSYPEKFLAAEGADWSGTVLEVAYNIWLKNGLDLFQIWFDHCRKVGIRPWASVRMNDVHYLYAYKKGDSGSFLVPKEYYENFDRHSRIIHRPQTQYMDRAKNYELQEVQDYMFSYLQEVLERYDVDGLELDFQREMRCFAPGHEQSGRAVMTAFVGRVKELVTEMEAKRGHKIEIAARANPLPEGCWEQGFDIIEWAKRGYLNLFIPAPRWSTTDNDMPIAIWKQILEPYGVKLAGGIEINAQAFSGSKTHVFNMTTETALGTAGYILSEGADSVYLFNYFGFHEHMDPAYDALNHPLSPSGNRYLLSTAGTLEKIQKAPRKCLVTHRDFEAIWRTEDNGDLPKTVSKTTDPVYFHCRTGDILPTSKVTLHLGLAGEGISEQDVAVYLNSCPVKFLGNGACQDPVLTESTVYTFEVPAAAIQPLTQVAEVLLTSEGKTLTVDYMEITIE